MRSPNQSLGKIAQPNKVEAIVTNVEAVARSASTVVTHLEAVTSSVQTVATRIKAVVIYT